MRKRRKQKQVTTAVAKPKPVQMVQRQLDPNLERSLDACISRILTTPKERKVPLTQKQAHVGLEALIYKADHYSALQGLTLEHAYCELQYKDKQGKEQTVCANIEMKGLENERQK